MTEAEKDRLMAAAGAGILLLAALAGTAYNGLLIGMGCSHSNKPEGYCEAPGSEWALLSLPVGMVAMYLGAILAGRRGEAAPFWWGTLAAVIGNAVPWLLLGFPGSFTGLLG